MSQTPGWTGVYKHTLPLSADDDLRYTIALPQGYAPDDPAPLVLALHYSWDRSRALPPFYGQGLLRGLVAPALSELGAVIVAPDCPAHDWTNPQSADALLALLAHLQKTVPIDADKQLLTGYSLGGAGTWYLAARHPDLFSAALPISGPPHQASVARIAHLPFYVIHSHQDEHIPIAQTQAAVRQLEDQGVPVKFVAVEGPTHYETFRFVEPLQAAVPWIKAVWTREKGTG